MRSLFFLTVLFALGMGMAVPLTAEDDVNLSKRQTGVAERYQRLEELLLRLADVESAENPERSALLRRAARQSRDKFVLEKLRSASESLRSQEFQKAVDNQEVAEQELTALLKLLLSEDRSKRIRDEKERFTKLIKDLKRNLNNQRSARARTENGADIDDVQKEQKAVTERSEELKEQLSKENEASDASQSDAKSPDAESDAAESDAAESEGAPKDKAGEEQKDGAKPKDNPADAKEKGKEKEKDSAKEPDPADENKESGDSSRSDDPSKGGDPAQQKPSDPSQSKEQPPSEQGDPQQSQQSQGKSQENQPPSSQKQSQQQDQAQPQSPEQEVEQQLQQAIEKMREAEKELEQAKREQATEKQRQAEENLRAAIDRLERILRQLREEEMQRELAKLESRLRKMAAMQSKVLDETVALAAVPVSQRNRQTDLKAGDLAFEEKKITLESDRAMLLLREEGSSVAFPEVVSQIRSDTVRVAELLGQTKIDAITQGIQQDILAALEEMIGALQKAQRDLEQKRQQQQQGQPSPSGQEEQPLVEALAELKLIRTMETRIKTTTDRYSGLLESGESSVDNVLPLLQDLSERQNRLYRITRDLVLKRNQ